MATIGVAGFGRCGSTMAMAMLHAGGIEPVDGSRTGSPELPDLASGLSLPAAAMEGRSIKVLDGILRYEWPREPDWSFVWMDRDWEHHARSFVKFIRATSPEIDLPADAEEVIQESFKADRPKALALYRDLGPVVILRYEAVLADPLKAARALRRLAPNLDVQAAARAVHRRSPECRRGLDFERAVVRGENFAGLAGVGGAEDALTSSSAAPRSTAPQGR